MLSADTVTIVRSQVTSVTGPARIPGHIYSVNAWGLQFKTRDVFIQPDEVKVVMAKELHAVSYGAPSTVTIPAPTSTSTSTVTATSTFTQTESVVRTYMVTQTVGGQVTQTAHASPSRLAWDPASTIDSLLVAALLLIYLAFVAGQRLGVRMASSSLTVTVEKSNGENGDGGVDVDVDVDSSDSVLDTGVMTPASSCTGSVKSSHVRRKR